LYNCKNETDPNTLFASFDAPYVVCVNEKVNFVNTSIMPNSRNTGISWYLDDKLVSRRQDYSHTFTEAGWYEMELSLQQGRNRSKVLLPVEVLGPAKADLGPDTTLCASAFLLNAGSNEHSIRWSRIISNGNSSSIDKGDFSTLEYINFKILGGKTAGFTNKYLLVNAAGKIIRVSSDTKFYPVKQAGKYRFYSVHFWPEEEVKGLKKGKKFSDIQFPPNSCGGISKALEFRVWASEDLGSEPYLAVNKSGIYVLRVEDACGNIEIDTLNLKLTKECVWPGDISLDGRVSMADFLCLGLANGQEGKSRSNISTEWKAHRSRKWLTGFDTENSLAPGVNHKHADINGDGRVDMDEDLKGLVENMKFFHELIVPDFDEGASFFIQHHDTRFSNDGDTAFIEVGMYMEGYQNSRVEDVYGLAFNLNFSDPIFQKPSFSPSDNWPGSRKYLSFYSGEEPFLYGAQNLPGGNFRYSFGVISGSRSNFAGRGLIASGNIIVIVDDIVDDEINSGYSSFGIAPERVLMVDDKGRIQNSLPARSLSAYELEIKWPSPPINWLNLRAWKEAKDVLIEWNTEGERFSDLFEIERSIDGRLYERIGEVQAAAQNKGSYNFRDMGASLLEGQVLSYRIRRVDVADRQAYSDTYELKIGAEAQEKLKVFPNPFTEHLEISYAIFSNRNAYVEVHNSLGQSFYLQDDLKDFGELTVSTANWPSGMYFVKLSSEKGSQVFKIIKP
ncbi:MAG: T9SS type A sorting domain-containing protein, partial [Bacteroidota bacterium]